MLETLLPDHELEKLQTNPSETQLWIHWEEFVTHYLREGKSEVTIKNVRDVLKFILRNTKITSIEQCNTPKILRETLFEIKEQRNWSNVTLNSYIKSLNTYFLWLEDMEYIEKNKIKKIRKCKEEQNEQYTLSEEQVKLLLGHTRTRRQTRLERWRNDFFISLLVLTGARPCELLQLQFRDVQKMGDGYKVVIRGRKQKGRPRYYRLPSWVSHIFEVYVQTRQMLDRNEINLFVSTSKTTGWTEKGMRGLFRNISKEIGFKVTAYSIRRFVATKLNEEGVEMRDIQNHMGHTRASTTQRYIERSCILTDKSTESIQKFTTTLT